MNQGLLAIAALALGFSLTAHPTVVRAEKAEKNEVHRSFYDSKKLDTTRAACSRAESRLRRLHVGASELQFLELMEMEVIARRGKPVDARMDGYLALRSKAVNARLGDGRRALVFGYVEGGSEVAVATVVLREHRVEEVRFTEPILAEARTTGGSGGTTGSGSGGGGGGGGDDDGGESSANVAEIH